MWISSSFIYIIVDDDASGKMYVGFGTDEEAVISVLGHRNANQMKKIRETYHQLYNESLIDRLHSELSGDFRLLVGLVSSYRYDKEVVDPEAAMLEAARLNEAINKKQLDHDDVFWILSTRNVFQLRATFAYYKQLYGNPLEQDIKNCGKGDLESLLNVIVCCIDCPEKHFAKKLQ
ncbi:annexin D3-like isoform X2 [Prosopis cineraria]|uniref:annexin D3-like isoform X2 n=1 Tax=Prosopis cineraria TaxID=364024 RepID=UPI0024104921|nr:annexin D3-like isoform X2 [Prosopis cineraria]